MLGLIALVIAGLAAAGFVMSRRRAVAAAGTNLAALHSRPSYHGLYTLLWVVIAGYATLLVVSLIGATLVDGAVMTQIAAATPDAPEMQRQLMLADAKAIASGGIASATDATREAAAQTYASLNAIRVAAAAILSLAAAAAAGWLSFRRVSLAWRARNRSEAIIRGVLLACAAIAVLTTVGIVLSLVGETLIFFKNIDWRVGDYLFGTTWSPLSGVHEGKMDPAKVGAVPLFVGTFLITAIAMLVAVPVGLFSAVYLSDFASPRVRAVAKPMLEILAGIPTVVYGFFAAITVAPFIRNNGDVIVPVLAVVGAFLVAALALLVLARVAPNARAALSRLGWGVPAFFGLFGAAALVLLWTGNPSFRFDVASESALAAGVVMGIMIIPFISSLSDDVINAVPQALRDGSYGLGATKAETIRQVVLPAALPGIVSAVLLGVSRAVGETMIVVMAAGQGANLTANPLEAVTTVTVQIVMLITGDTEASTAAGPAFTLGFTLFCVTLALNIIALRIVRKYRELYD